MFIPKDVPQKLEPAGFVVPSELFVSALLSDPETTNSRSMAIELLLAIHQKMILIKDRKGIINSERVLKELSSRNKDLRDLAQAELGGAAGGPSSEAGVLEKPVVAPPPFDGRSDDGEQGAGLTETAK